MKSAHGALEAATSRGSSRERIFGWQLTAIVLVVVAGQSVLYW